MKDTGQFAFPGPLLSRLPELNGLHADLKEGTGKGIAVGSVLEHFPAHA